MTVNIISDTPVAGQSLTLKCHAVALYHTSSYYQWILPNGSMADGDYFAPDKLTLSPLLESHTGEYSCQFTIVRGADKLVGCGVKWINVQGRNILSNIICTIQ